MQLPPPKVDIPEGHINEKELEMEKVYYQHTKVLVKSIQYETSLKLTRHDQWIEQSSKIWFSLGITLGLVL